ncbi:MAG: hypothetical protein SFZ02_22035 [bacterium]|nr:hypothetical protein [bacterium]
MAHYIAKRFVASSPNAEINGQVMISFSDNLEARIIKPILEAHGILEIDPEKWYSQQLWLDILKDMQDKLAGEATSALVAMGKQVVSNAVWPDSVQSIPDALNVLHFIHQSNLRDIPSEEGYSLEAKGEQHYIIYHNTPNPDDGIYGFLWGIGARFKKPGESFTVKMIDNPAPHKASSAFEIIWG